MRLRAWAIRTRDKQHTPPAAPVNTPTLQPPPLPFATGLQGPAAETKPAERHSCPTNVIRNTEYRKATWGPVSIAILSSLRAACPVLVFGDGPLRTVKAPAGQAAKGKCKEYEATHARSPCWPPLTSAGFATRTFYSGLNGARLGEEAQMACRMVCSLDPSSTVLRRSSSRLCARTFK